MSTNDPFITQINNVISQLKGKFTPNKTLMTAIAGHMHASVMHNFETEGADVPGGWPQKMFPGKPLQGEGNLIRSINASATDNESIVSTNRMGAWLMHHGGKIQAKKKLGSVKRKRDVWAMEQFFWRRWYESEKKEYRWKVLALHMQSHNYLTVPARPFMVLTESYSNKIIDEINKHVLN